MTPTIDIRRLLDPKSVAILGMSTKPGAAHTILGNLTLNKYQGDIHLVGRSGGEFEGRTILTSVEDLPEGVDLAVFMVPAAAVQETLEACVRRKIGAAIVFAAGYAEMGNHEAQALLARTARDGGIALLGPNCLGYTNSLNGLRFNFAGLAEVPPIDTTRDPGLALISHSGGLLSHMRLALEARHMPVAYAVSTGNEAGLGLAEFVEFFADDPSTHCLLMYVEQVRDPSRFLTAARKARDSGKPLVMMHPGRGERAKGAMSSHTGALAGDYALMRTVLEDAGVILLDTLDEVIDTTELMARYPTPPVKGAGVLTFSGAFCAIAYDFCEDIGLDLPTLAPETDALLKEALPPFAPPRNPLDLTTQPVFQPDLMRVGPKAMLDDPNLGSLTVSISIGSPGLGMKLLNALVQGRAEGARKPMIFSILGGDTHMTDEFLGLAKGERIILSRSVDRSLRAMARATFFGRALARAKAADARTPIAGLPDLPHGTVAEWQGKAFLKAAGFPVPEGGLGTSVEEAVAIAARIGYPVALKGQATALSHKTEAGAVLLNIADEAQLRAAWTRLYETVAARSGVALDGALVERMAPKGLELVLGARRDPSWGPVLLVGLGGIWVEALGDVRLLPPDLAPEAIQAELLKLRTAKLLKGFRGQPPVDLAAVARAAALLGRIMLTRPEIAEIDINPIFAHADGEGVTAVDALIVTG